jgi:hypothetical protein
MIHVDSDNNITCYQILYGLSGIIYGIVCMSYSIPYILVVKQSCDHFVFGPTLRAQCNYGVAKY